jgi:hypothetical protein
MDIEITLTTDYYVWLPQGFFHFDELSCHLTMLQNMGKSLVS